MENRSWPKSMMNSPTKEGSLLMPPPAPCFKWIHHHMDPCPLPLWAPNKLPSQPPPVLVLQAWDLLPPTGPEWTSGRPIHLYGKVQLKWTDGVRKLQCQLLNTSFCHNCFTFFLLCSLATNRLMKIEAGESRSYLLKDRAQLLGGLSPANIDEISLQCVNKG